MGGEFEELVVEALDRVLLFGLIGLKVVVLQLQLFNLGFEVSNQGLFLLFEAGVTAVKAL